ncbi:hypothetical protein AMTRI_Chr02g221440 [Amborella trichopoda]
MAKKKCALSTRAWSLVRFALLWARKGGIFKRGFIRDLKLLARCPHHSELTAYRQFSFGDSPAVQLKLPRSIVKFPCMNPPITLDNDYDHDDNHEYDIDPDGNGAGYDHSHEDSYYDGDRNASECDELIDSKADEFIERFYQQMRLQRQLSCLKYNEMLHRGVS